MNLSPEELAREKRDRLFRRLLLWSLIPLALGYLIADGVGLLPAEISVRIRNNNRNAVDPDYLGEGADPNMVLGIAIGDTRFRLNYGNGHAVVTRPVFGVEEWIIPAHFDYQGTHFTVVALDPFAFLYATHAHTISLPPTLEHDNGAPELNAACLRHLYLRKQDGSAQHITYPRAPETTGQL